MNDNIKCFKTIDAELSEWIRSVFTDIFEECGHDFANVSAVPTANSEFGDFQCNDCMQLGKVLKQSPRNLAQAVKDKAVLHESLDRIEIAGPGFINMYLKTDWLARYIERMTSESNLGVPLFGSGRTVVIDYSSPNVAKPMHIGHIRSTIIGNAIDRMYRMLGYRVVADNHIGDWGTQFGIIINGYRAFVDMQKLKESPIEELERVYVKSYEKGKADEDWMNQCRQELVKLQAGDKDNNALWKEFVKLSLTEFDRIYARLGVSFDHVRGESFYRNKLQAVMDLLASKGLTAESEGATVVFLEDEKLPVCIVRKRDGGFNYAATDIATALSRVEEYNPERIVYVTDERQQLHFRQLFSICEKIGVETRLDHVWFGLMRLPEGTFSTREGNVIKLERLLDEAESRALAIVRESSPDMDEGQQKEIARSVGIGAVKYADLSQNPQTTVTFTWEKAMATDGNSGPYLQYAYARIASVRDKYAERFPGVDPDSYALSFAEPIERTLALKLIQFPEVVVRAANGFKPSTMADYLYDIAQTYSSFYQNVPFLKAEEGVRESRIRLCGITAKILKTGLQLLGIETPERI